MRLDQEERLILEYLYDQPKSRTLGCRRQDILLDTDLRYHDGEAAIKRLRERDLVRWYHTFLRITPDGEEEVYQYRSWAGKLSRSRLGKTLGSVNAVIDEWPHVWKVAAWLLTVIGAFILGRVT